MVWNPEQQSTLIERLAAFPDAVVARQTGLDRETVRTARRVLGVAPGYQEPGPVQDRACYLAVFYHPTWSAAAAEVGLSIEETRAAANREADRLGQPHPTPLSLAERAATLADLGLSWERIAALVPTPRVSSAQQLARYWRQRQGVAAAAAAEMDGDEPGEPDGAEE